MSDLFLKNSIKNNDFYTTESSFNVSKILNKNNHLNNKLSLTSSNNLQIGGSATSSANLSKINTNDINNLLSMITSESSNVTRTDELENKLKKLLNQEGGNFSENTSILENNLNQEGGNFSENTSILENNLKTLLNQEGGNFSEDTTMLENKLRNYININNIDTEVLENKMMNIINKQNGGTVSGLMKSVATLAVLGGIGAMLNKNNDNITESDFKPEKIINKNNNNNNNIQNSESSMDNSVFIQNQNKQNKDGFNTTTDLSPTSDIRISELKNKYNIQSGGDNPALAAFRDISKLVSIELKISNGPSAKKIAGQLQRDVKDKHPTIKLDKLVQTAEEHLKNNINKYKKMTEIEKND